MNRVTVDSSALRSVGYDPTRQVLRIEFTSGAVYEYDDVPPEAHDDLMAADSHGQCFNALVRDRYPYRRLGAPDRRQGDQEGSGPAAGAGESGPAAGVADPGHDAVDASGPIPTR
ncbi:MAG: KTSC domain-containing protein [Egibacteraceae bacterium]